MKKKTQKNVVLHVRVLPQSLFSSVIAAAFLFAFITYFWGLPVGLFLLSLALIILVVAFFTNSVAFDGKRLCRTGTLPRIAEYAFGSRRHLRLRDIDRVETQTHRLFRYRGRIFYRYRTTFYGRDLTFSVNSIPRGYAELMRRLLPHLAESILDLRTLEVRDFYTEVDQVKRLARTAGIPDSDVLEDSLRSAIDKRVPNHVKGPTESHDLAKAAELSSLGNRLKSAGLLLPAIEAFRRALRLHSADARILFGLARSLRSLAGAEGDHKLE
ncbi:MAG: hypothetical protein LC734_09670, partial [Acidobacteria bacterium]|nr:hypothetical protein [Acidobacteriota bacterium]